MVLSKGLSIYFTAEGAEVLAEETQRLILACRALREPPRPLRLGALPIAAPCEH